VNRSPVMGSFAQEWRSVVEGAGYDIRDRYRGSVMSHVWSILEPVLYIALYSIVFTTIMRSRIPGLTSDYAYPLYLCCGLLPWMVFAEAVQAGTQSIHANALQIKKYAMSCTAYVAKAVLVALHRMIIVLVLLCIVGWAMGLKVSAAWAGLIIIAALLGVLALGVAMILAPLNVFFRDVSEGTPIALQLCMWSLPIVYPATILPPGLGATQALHPLFPYFDEIRRVFLDGSLPTAGGVFRMLAASAIVLILGWFVSRALETEVRDSL
jgi:lipopolysaccharide transport system permease protein